LSESQIVHSDLKTENILIKHDEADITEVKLIDYGSSFSFSQIHQFSMATPEYMPHEILNYILCENDSEYDDELLQKVKNYKNPWVIDIWSLGCVLLEIINGVPLWMSLPLLVDVKGKPEKKYGLFAVKGRVFQKIIDKQVEVI
jgi:dual specificity tyrosine-phosphorylation-regulated kinase 2/3/4